MHAINFITTNRRLSEILLEIEPLPGFTHTINEVKMLALNLTASLRLSKILRGIEPLPGFTHTIINEVKMLALNLLTIAPFIMITLTASYLWLCIQ